MIFSLDGRHVFASNEWENTVSAIEVNGGTAPVVVGAIPVDQMPVGVAGRPVHSRSAYQVVILLDVALKLIAASTKATNSIATASHPRVSSMSFS